MQSLISYLRLPEGRFILALLCAIALFDAALRLWPAPVAKPEASQAENVTSFEPIEPSGQFRAWVDGRREAKDQVLAAQKAQEAAKKQQPPTKTVQKAFVDRQSGQLQNFRVGNLKYRLWGVFSLKDASAGSASTFAVLRPDKGESKVVTVGEMVGDYTVLSVQDRSVGFKAEDGREVTLELFERRG